MVGGAGLPTSNTSAPNAYLNYILFDDNYVPYDFGYDQVSEAGALPGGPDKMMLEAKVRKPGYLYIYVSNENPTVAEVYFDDLKIKHVKSPVLQYNEYYAYGLQTGNSWTREATTPNNFLGNSGTELNTTTSLYDLEYRNYDPALARMRQVDPLASKYASINPYNYSFNNPAAFTDPSGAEPANENYRYYREQSNQRVVDAGAFFRNTSFGAGVFRGGNPQSMFNPGWSPSSNSLMSVGGMTGTEYTQMREDARSLSPQEYGFKYGQGVSVRQAALMLAAYNASVLLENIQFQREKLNDSNLIASAGNDYNPFNYQKSSAGGELTLANLLTHYIGGSGDEYILNEDSFKDLVVEMYRNGRLNPEGAGLINSGSGINGLWKLDFSAYGTKYENAVGSGTLYFDKSGIVGYSDKWNFEKQGGENGGGRDWWSETKTSIGSIIPGKLFWVLYGTVPPESFRPQH